MLYVYLFMGLAIIVFVIFWLIGVSNKFKTYKVKIDEAESGIDVALTQRYDLLTKMFDVTKAYMKHERSTLESIIKARKPKSTDSFEDKQKLSKDMSQALREVNITLENYPELKSNSTVVELQKAATRVEENLQSARRIYNSNVSNYNRLLVVFPSSLIAKIQKREEEKFFEADEVKRDDISFDFES